MELVVAIGKGQDIPQDQANNHIFGYACGLDMTRRDPQIAMREKGCPGKSVRHSTIRPPAPRSNRHPRSVPVDRRDLA